jgi:hypothetical protein
LLHGATSMIEATSGQCRTMADGTLRLTVDISPTHAQDAFRLFGMAGLPMVLARLTPEAAKYSAQDAAIEADGQAKGASEVEQASEDEIKGGKLSQWAAQRCNDHDFYMFLRKNFDAHYTGTPVDIQDYCRKLILITCGIESRRWLDHDVDAAAIFNGKIRIPYSECRRWLATK